MPDRPVDAAAHDVPFVSVIIPVYNGAATVADCVESLLALQYPRDRCEIVVVDNGSTDATREILARFEGRIRVLHESRRGAAAARNRGIREANGTVVAFTDADAVVDPAWLDGLVSHLHPGTGAVGGPILSRRPANRIEQFGEVVHDHRFAIEDCDPPYMASGNWASPRDLLVAVGLFDEDLLRGQDADLAFRLHRAGHRLTYGPDAIVYHRNKRTIAALFREGLSHGIAGVRVREKNAPAFPGMRRHSRVTRRLAGHVGRLLREGDRVTTVLRIVFDSGKFCGELVALAGRRRPASADDAPPQPVMSDRR